MRRYTPNAEPKSPQLVVVGGGIHGAAIAYTAGLNGLRTVLLERDDFTSHASANSQKVIHGGLRYLQSLDLKRVVESIRERQRFYHLFPHLVKPLPCLLPTSGYGTKGNEAFRLAFLIYQLICQLICRGPLRKNLDHRPRLLGKNELVGLFPHLAREKLRGGALWYDGLCLEPERVVISLLKAAALRGAGVANYAEVVEIGRKGQQQLVLTVNDHLKKQHYQLTTQKVALCTGAFFKEELGCGPLPEELAELSLIRGMNLLLPQLFATQTSLACRVRSTTESRFLFTVPWKEYSIAGTHWEHCTDPRAPWPEKPQTIETFRALLAEATPDRRPFPAPLAEHLGCVPGNPSGRGNAADQILGHFRLVDREPGKPGDILQVVGVKFTTAFDVASKALRRLFPDTHLRDTLDFPALPAGSPTGDPAALLVEYQRRYQAWLNPEQLEKIFQLLGDELPAFMDTILSAGPPDQGKPSDTELYRRLAAFSVDQEMVFHLDDLIARRLFADTPMPAELLSSLADCLAELLAWSPEQRAAELARLRQPEGDR